MLHSGDGVLGVEVGGVAPHALLVEDIGQEVAFRGGGGGVVRDAEREQQNKSSQKNHARFHVSRDRKLLQAVPRFLTGIFFKINIT
eukprot:SAG31_NODE_14099_length_827_cov_1.123626_1_plen_86_part_00